MQLYMVAQVCCPIFSMLSASGGFSSCSKLSNEQLLQLSEPLISSDVASAASQPSASSPRGVADVDVDVPTSAKRVLSRSASFPDIRDRRRRR